MLAGCQTATLSDGSAAPASAPGADEPGVAQLVQYGRSVRTLDAARLEQEYIELSAANRLQPSDANTIKLSLLLSDPAAPFYDAERAMRLLNDVARRLEAAEDPLAAFPRLLDQLLIERRGVVEERESLSEALESERSRNESLSQQLEKSQADLAAERKRSQTLQGQLDALRALEKQINLDDPDR